MSLYAFCAVLHVLAAVLWIGHMVFWSIVVGPMLKRFEPAERADELRAAVHRFGGLGWPALGVFLLTGPYLLYARGMFEPGAFADLFERGGGLWFVLKLVLVAGMVLYQLVIGHRPAPKLIYVNMLAAFVIVLISIVLVRHPEIGLPLLESRP